MSQSNIKSVVYGMGAAIIIFGVIYIGNQINEFKETYSPSNIGKGIVEGIKKPWNDQVKTTK